MTEKLEEQTEVILESQNTDEVRNSSQTERTESGISTSENNESDNGESATNDEPVDNPESGDKNEPENFPRSYVEKLRDENAKYRQRAQRSDDLAQRLHEALVTATGRLQDPSDLGFDESHLDDPEALQAAIEDLLARKPHLASRRPLGDIGQGVTNGNTGEVDLAALLRSRA